MSFKEALKGQFLIATPEIDSGIFFRSVIIICEHNSNGSLGLIINKTFDLTLPSDILNLEGMANQNLEICASGPVQTNQLMVLHDSEEVAEQTLEVLPGVNLGGDLDFLQKAAEDPCGPQLRLCFGYAGWSAGQLEQEFFKGSWFLCPAKKEHVFTKEPHKLWQELLLSMGGKYASLSMIPDDLTLN